MSSRKDFSSGEESSSKGLEKIVRAWLALASSRMSPALVSSEVDENHHPRKRSNSQLLPTTNLDYKSNFICLISQAFWESWFRVVEEQSHLLCLTHASHHSKGRYFGPREHQSFDGLEILLIAEKGGSSYARNRGV
jgi:hypothetical protein